MTLLDKTLSALGLMRVKAAKDWEARFKKAVQGLAQQAVEIEAYKEGAKALHRGLDEYMAEINRLIAENEAIRPDAEKWRAKAARDAEVKRAKRAAAKKVAG